MPRIEKLRAHAKSLDDAKKALAAAVADVRAKVPGGAPEPKFGDDGASVSVDADMFSASMSVDAAQVKVVVDLGFFAGFMKGTISAEIDKTLEKHFG
jgi:hypothetical protein